MKWPMAVWRDERERERERERAGMRKKKGACILTLGAKITDELSIGNELMKRLGKKANETFVSKKLMKRVVSLMNHYWRICGNQKGGGR